MKRAILATLAVATINAVTVQEVVDYSEMGLHMGTGAFMGVNGAVLAH